MRGLIFALLLGGCADVSKLDDFRFVDPPCEPESASTSCAGIQCGSVVNNCDEPIDCGGVCPGIQLCEVGDAAPNTCGCTSGDSPPTPPSSCGPAIAYMDSNHAYFVCDKREFDEARALCQSFGTDIVIISDALENEFVRGIVPLDDPTNPHLGLTDPNCQTPPDTACDLKWVDGSAPTFVNWGPGEPNNAQGVENCTEMRVNGGLWNDVSCGAQRHVICETTCP